MDHGRRSADPRLLPGGHTAGPLATEDLLGLWGRILGRDEDAADLVADHRAAVEGLRAPAGRSTTVLHATEGGAFVYQPDFEVARTMELAGLPVRLFPDQDGASFELSLEDLGSLDAEVLVLVQPYGPDPAAAALQEQPLFRSLPAVQAGRFLALDTAGSSALLSPTSLALPTTTAVLDRLRAL